MVVVSLALRNVCLVQLQSRGGSTEAFPDDRPPARQQGREVCKSLRFVLLISGAGVFQFDFG